MGQDRTPGGPTQVRGSSGATFIHHSNVTEKFGDARVGQQGAWLMSHKAPCLPEVIQIAEDGLSYRMETLCPVPSVMSSTSGTLTQMWYSLSDYIWSNNAEVYFDPNKHDDKLASLRVHMGPNEFHALMGKKREVKWSVLKRCLSHGDATVDNVMLRPNPPSARLVLIDPIPATPAIPDLQCVDVGKMLQSALGFECARYDVPISPRNTQHMVDTIKGRLSSDEWRASSYWCSVHLARALPYMPDPKTKGRVRELFTKSLSL